jgi:hypothetical protein
MHWWTIVDEGTMSGPSRWDLHDNLRLRQYNDIYGPSTSATTSRKGYLYNFHIHIHIHLGTFLIFDTIDSYEWEDYILKLALYSSENNGIGVVVRYTDTNNYYKIDLDRERQFKKLFRMKDGIETVVEERLNEYGYEQSVWFTVSTPIKYLV